MKKTFSCFGISAILFLSGCGGGSSIAKEVAFPSMYEENPVSILVVPAINISTAADAPDLYSSTINEPLSNAGFYVLPAEITDRFLRNEGLTDGAQIKEVAPEKFKELFGADAVFYATIYKWDTSYIIVGGSVTVGVEFELKSCETGKSLWKTSQQLTIDTSESGSGHIIADLLLTALKTATQDYVPIAQQVNKTALVSVPYGKYNNLHGQDRAVQVLVFDEVLSE